MGIRHDDGVCFGCSASNPVGLQLDASRSADGALVGRFQVQEGHVGVPGRAHTGLITAALHEMMALTLHAESVHAQMEHIEVEFSASASEGATVQITARVDDRLNGRITLDARASDGDGELAIACGRFLVTAAD